MSIEDLLNSRDLAALDNGESVKRMRMGVEQAIFQERVAPVINEFCEHLKSVWDVQMNHDEWSNFIRKVQKLFTERGLPFTGPSFDYARRTLLGLKTPEENLCDLVEDASDLGSRSVRRDFTQRQKEILGK